MHAIDEVIDHYSGMIKKDRRLLIVLVTDESGDDGGFVEEAHQAVMSRGRADLRHRPAVPLRLRTPTCGTSTR